jgi:hypothetical protein
MQSGANGDHDLNIEADTDSDYGEKKNSEYAGTCQRANSDQPSDQADQRSKR